MVDSTYHHLKVTVLDYAARDRAEGDILAEFPGAEIVHLANNKGYAGNTNVGILLALEGGADWVLVLNDDTVLAPECIEYLVAAGCWADDVGIVGPLVYHADEPDVIQSAGGLIDRYWRARHIGQNEEDVGQFTDVRPVDWVSGCAWMMRRSTVADIGLLDERFFCYWEETEWCSRAKMRDWQILHVPQAKLWHKGVQRDYRPSAAVTYFNTRNRLLFLASHDAPLAAWLMAWFEILRPLASWTLRPKWWSKRRHRRALRRGLADFMRGRWGEAKL